jgi:hypothetical protein
MTFMQCDGNIFHVKGLKYRTLPHNLIYPIRKLTCLWLFRFGFGFKFSVQSRRLLEDIKPSFSVCD